MKENGHRVLITDDEESLRFVLREILSREGCQVDEAEDGREAVDKALANGYDLYLLDMKMPRLSGLDALREIRAA
ncbi:MAG: response regulator [bacterium]|nr:response regulator [bacterium]